MASNSLEQLRQDLKEFETLRKDAKTQRVQTALDREIDQLKREVMSMEKVAAQNLAKTENGVKKEQKTVYTENITNYAWDQSDKFMKLYLTLENLGNITPEDIVSNFTERSSTVKVKFSNKICNLNIARLCEEIVPKDCYCKKKSEYVLVMLKKAESGKTWATVTEREKKKKDLDTPKMDADKDPSAGVTDLMKKMYDEGDDEMKRQITKAMYESQQKQQGGGDTGAGGMPGMGDAGGMPGMGGMGGMPGMEGLMGGMGGMPGMGGMGGAGGMPGMGGAGGMPGMGGAGGMPDMEKLMGGLGGMPGMEGLDMEKLMGGLGGKK